MRRAHQMVVHRVCKMIGGDAVGFQKHEILVVFGHFDRALDKIGEFDAILLISRGTQPHDIGEACLDLLQRLGGGKGAAGVA